MDMKEKAQSVATGFLILSVANILVKIMSLAFVPLIRHFLGGDAGYSVYSSAYYVYAFVYVIATAGFPVAVSKLVSEFCGTDRTEDAIRSFKLARSFLVAVGAILTAVVMIFAKPIAAFMNNEESWAGILCLAPTLFLCSLLSAYRGFFQGRKNMRPTAISQVAEQLVHVAVSFVLVIALRSYGIVWAVAGASVGTAIGALAALMIVVYKYNTEKSVISEKIAFERSVREHKGEAFSIISKKDIMKKMLYYSLPITFSSGVQYAGDLLDNKMIKGGLVASGLTEQGAKSLHGAYMAMRQLINVPGSLATALCISVLPVIAGAFAKKDQKEVSKNTEYGFKLCYLVAVPISFAMVLFAKPIYTILGYGDNYFLLTFSSLSVLLLCTMHLQSSVLQGVNKMFVSSSFLCVSVVIKIIMNYFLIRIPGLNIYGAIISSYVSYLIPVLLNYIFIKKVSKIKFSITRCLLLPVIAATVMVLLSYGLYSLLHWLIGFIISGYWGCLISFVPAVLFAVLVYYFVLRKLGGLTDDDLEQISPKLLRLLKKIKLA